MHYDSSSIKFDFLETVVKKQLKELKEKSLYLKQLLQQIAKNQQTSKTKGNLQILKTNGRLRLYQYFNTKSKSHYLKKSETQLIAALAQKRYGQQVYKAAKAKKKAIDEAIEILSQKEALVDLAKIYENFPKELKPVIKPMEQLYDDYAKQWQTRDYEKSRRPVGTNLRTKKGELVRSKSELIIANKLYDAGLPYHYETIFRTEQFIANPDFFILNPRTRKVFYWEHFGLMSKQDYLEDALYKIEGYAKYGVIQGDNLIVTYESVDHQLSTEYVDQLIERFLISG